MEQNKLTSKTGLSYTQKDYYSGHMNKHAGVKPFQCVTCYKCFRSSSTLRRHKGSCSGQISCCSSSETYGRKWGDSNLQIFTICRSLQNCQLHHRRLESPIVYIFIYLKYTLQVCYAFNINLTDSFDDTVSMSFDLMIVLPPQTLIPRISN